MTILATLLPAGEIQFSDANGDPLSAGIVHFYVPNTTTPKNTWTDPGQVTLNTNPVILDSAGRATIYGTGQYSMALYDVNGALVYTALTSSTPLAGQYLEFDGSGNFTLNIGPNLYADTAGRLVGGFNVVLPAGATYNMADSDRGAAIGTENSTGTLTVLLPDPSTVGNGYYALFHRGVTNNMIVTSDSNNIFTTQYRNGTNSVTLPNPSSFLGLYATDTNWAMWTGSADMSYQAGSSLVYSETEQTIPDNTDTARTWTTVLHDYLGCWSAGNPTRLTVPAGVTKVKLSGNTRFSATTATGKFHFCVFKNGALFTGSPYLEIATAGFSVYPAGNITSPDLFVTPGDYFEFVVLQETGGPFTTENAVAGVNWFSMEILQYASQV